ncbi:uncharacterized protein LOC124267636 [Haliotis rubra]|uniref:uncharacterized protein LOC124267636 n=1 Tax=Haliotis rubra TaxID=36100 RepID=UPI001EE5349C|nr:uncharacterized protein LOC124267636 [Haliotis rubra]
MNIFLQVTAVLSLQFGFVVVHGQSYVLTSSCGGVVTEGSSCVLNCETGSATETHIIWKRGASVIYEVARATCETPKSASTIPFDYVFDCPGTSFTLSITSASVIRDKTTWTCDAAFGGKDSSINLDVPATATLSTTNTNNHI